MLKAIKIRLYPNKTQETYLGKLLGSYRFVFNNCLALKKNAYLVDKSNLGLKELGHYFHNELTKSEDFKWLKEHNTKVLKQSIINLMEAYKRFFVNGSGFPKFKSKHDNISSCRFPVDAISRRNNYLDGKLTLTKELKNLKFKCSDNYKIYLDKYKDGIKSATLSKSKSGKYFLSILVDSDEILVLKKSNKTVGIDLGIKDFIVTSEGETFDNLKTIRSSSKKLVKLNRQLSKKSKGSKNKEKVRIKLAKFHEKLNDKKINYLYSVVNQLLNENQVIVMEDLNVSGMMKNHKLAKSIQELSLGKFKEILKYKAEWSGRYLVEIDRFFPSSKLCSVCGYKHKDLKLSEREWTCPDCGELHHRDLNAAINIRNEGLRLLQLEKIGSRTAEFTLEDCPLMDDPASNGMLKSNGRKIQEKIEVNFMDINFHKIPLDL